MKYWILRTSHDFRLADWLRDFNWLSDDRLIDGWEIQTRDGEPEPGDYIFFWQEDTPETSGIAAEGKSVALPEIFPMAGQKPGYYTLQARTGKSGGERQTAVKYIRLCLAQPVTERELESGETSKIVLSIFGLKERMAVIPEPVGKYIEMLLRNRTTMIDLTYCQT
jgi:hypothetical protein